jgi:hypothetical protein
LLWARERVSERLCFDVFVFKGGSLASFKFLNT